jgi:hypothetical protein
MLSCDPGLTLQDAFQRTRLATRHRATILHDMSRCRLRSGDMPWRD